MKQLKNVKDCYDLTAEEYTKNFYDELSHKPFDRLILRQFAAQNREKGTIADLGCGCGHTTKFLREAGAKDLIGIDLSSEMIKNASRINGEINFKVGNILALAAKDEEFGAVLAFYAIVHFTEEEIEKAFSEVYRVLKPAGQFLFSFHVGTGQKHLEEFLHQKVDVTFHFFEVDEILETLKKAGFRILDALVRYPYEEVEYPSKRAYILAEK